MRDCVYRMEGGASEISTSILQGTGQGSAQEEVPSLRAYGDFADLMPPQSTVPFEGTAMLLLKLPQRVVCVECAPKVVLPEPLPVLGHVTQAVEERRRTATQGGVRGKQVGCACGRRAARWSRLGSSRRDAVHRWFGCLFVRSFVASFDRHRSL